MQEEKVPEIVEAPKAPESTPKPEAPKAETPKPSIKAEADLTGVPDVMIPTARYWLQRTGHAALTANDKEALRELSKTQYPTYVNKQIDVAVERFNRLNRDLKTLHLGYIVKCLSGKNTYDPDRKPTGRHKKAAKMAAKAQGVQEVVSSASVEDKAEHCCSDEGACTL